MPAGFIAATSLNPMVGDGMRAGCSVRDGEVGSAPNIMYLNKDLPACPLHIKIHTSCPLIAAGPLSVQGLPKQWYQRKEESLYCEGIEMPVPRYHMENVTEVCDTLIAILVIVSLIIAILVIVTHFNYHACHTRRRLETGANATFGGAIACMHHKE